MQPAAPQRSHAYLVARAKLAEDWYRERKINYAELERLQCDSMHGCDSGPVKWNPGKEPK